MIREILKTPEQFQTLQIGDLICGIEVGPNRPIISPNDDPTFMGIIKDLNAYEPNGSFSWSLSDNPERFKATMRDIISSYNGYGPHDRDCTEHCEIIAYRLFDSVEDVYHGGTTNTVELCLYYEETVAFDYKKELSPNWIPFRAV